MKSYFSKLTVFAVAIAMVATSFVGVRTASAATASLQTMIAPTVIAASTDYLQAMDVDGDLAVTVTYSTGILSTIDLSVTPPVVLDTYTNSFLERSFEVLINGDYAYISNPEGANPSRYSLAVVDISDPYNIGPITEVTTMGSWTSGFDTYRMTIVGDYLLATFGNGVGVFNIANPATPVGIDWTSGTHWTRGIAAEEKTDGVYIYSVGYANQTISGTRFVNGTGPAGSYQNFVETLFTITDPNFAGANNMVMYEADNGITYLVVISETNSVLSFVDITDPRTPIILGTTLDASDTPALNRPVSMKIKESHLVVISHSGSISIIDLADPTVPSTIEIQAEYTSSFAHDLGSDVILRDDGIAFGTFRGSGTLQMFDIAQFLTDSSTGSVGTATSGGSGSGISRVAVIFMRAANIARRRIEDGVRCPGFTEIMKNGTNSEDVARLETLLTITSGFKGAINTVFDDATTLALKAFQTSKGIEQTGVYGAQTHTAMSQVCRDLNTTTTI